MSKFEVLSKVRGLVQSLKFCGITPWPLAFEESPCHPFASEDNFYLFSGSPWGNRQSPSKTVISRNLMFLWRKLFLGEPSITVKNRHAPLGGSRGTINHRQTPTSRAEVSFRRVFVRVWPRLSFWGTGQLGFLEDDRGFFYAGTSPLKRQGPPSLI